MRPDQHTPKSTRQNTFPPESLKREINRLYVLSNLFDRIFKAKFEKKDGVTLVDWKVIEAVFLCKGVTASEIIDFWGLDKTAVSRSVVRLEKRGFIHRKVSTTDRRHNHLFLTPRGRRMFAKLQNFKEYLFQEIEKHLSAGELHQMGETAEKMIDHLRKMLAESDAYGV